MYASGLDECETSVLCEAGVRFHPGSPSLPFLVSNMIPAAVVRCRSPPRAAHLVLLPGRTWPALPSSSSGRCPGWPQEASAQ